MPESVPSGKMDLFYDRAPHLPSFSLTKPQRFRRCQFLGQISHKIMNLYTVEPLYNGHLRTEFSGRCEEVAVMGRFSTRGFE